MNCMIWIPIYPSSNRRKKKLYLDFIFKILLLRMLEIEDFYMDIPHNEKSIIIKIIKLIFILACSFIIIILTNQN